MAIGLTYKVVTVYQIGPRLFTETVELSLSTRPTQEFSMIHKSLFVLAGITGIVSFISLEIGYALAYYTDGHAQFDHPVLDIDEDGILDQNDNAILVREWTWSSVPTLAWIDQDIVGEQHFPTTTVTLNGKPFVVMTRDEAEAILGPL